MEIINLTFGGIFCDLEKAFESINHDIHYLNVNFMDSGAKPMHCYDHTSVIDIRKY
jgi:hypothetical protein